MGFRRQARELALQALFAFDMDKNFFADYHGEFGALGLDHQNDLKEANLSEDHKQKIDLDDRFFNNNLDAFCDINEGTLNENIKPFFLELVKGATTNNLEIDALLNKYSKHWKLSRMPIVDRNIMRIAVFEFLEHKDIPFSVTINEAVEIGKKYGTRDSGSFINGVLDRIKTAI